MAEKKKFYRGKLEDLVDELMSSEWAYGGPLKALQAKSRPEPPPQGQISDLPDLDQVAPVSHAQRYLFGTTEGNRSYSPWQRLWGKPSFDQAQRQELQGVYQGDPAIGQVQQRGQEVRGRAKGLGGASGIGGVDLQPFEQGRHLRQQVQQFRQRRRE